MSEEPDPRPLDRRILAVTGVIVVAVAGFLVFMFSRGGSDGGSSVALALAFRDGHVYRYQSSFRIDANIVTGSNSSPVDAQANGPTSLRVLSKTGDGIATVEVTIGPHTASTNGEAETIPQTSFRMVIAPDGEVVAGGGLGGGLTQSLGGGAGLPATEQLTPLLPDHRVSPGDTWDTTVDRSLSAIGSGRVHFTAHSTLLRYEDIHGVRTAVIESRMSIPMDFTIDLAKVTAQFGDSASAFPSVREGEIRYEGSVDAVTTSWLDLERRWLEKTVSTGTMDISLTPEWTTPAPGSPVTMSGTLTTTLVRAP